MSTLLRAIRKDWEGALLIAILAALLIAFTTYHARQSDLMMRTLLDCPPEHVATYSPQARSGIRCVRIHRYSRRGDPNMQTLRYAPVDIEVIHMTDSAIKVDGGRDEHVWIPFSAIEDEEAARELQVGELAEIGIEESLAMNKGLI